jgi:phosphoribosylformylglycinamidine (FGAM) synthase PurS component
MKIILEKEALERLIGGDSEIEVQIRQSVAHAFAEKYLKPLMHNNALEAIGAKLKKQGEDYVDSMFSETLANVQTDRWGSKSYQLKESIKNQIKREVNDCATETIKKHITDELAAWTDEKFEKMIGFYVDQNIELEVKKRVAAKFEAFKKQF